MNDLRQKMEELTAFVRQRLDQGQTDHWTLCQVTAKKFDLWDADNRFPLWLSFVVQGEMRERGL